MRRILLAAIMMVLAACVAVATEYWRVGRRFVPEDVHALDHEHGVTVTAHSYGNDGDWAAIREGVDGIEHLVNVPHELPNDMIEVIRARNIYVCPTLSGSSYTVLKFLRNPDLLHTDPDLIANVSASVRCQAVDFRAPVILVPTAL